MPERTAAQTAILVKGYPRISETFIARELLGLQERGLEFVIISLRRPTDRIVHDLHERITAPVLYLPEYLHEEPVRVLRGLLKAARLTGTRRALRTWLRDLWRDPTRNRVRRFGQALVLAAELGPEVRHLYAHFIHTPGSVARYAGLLRGLPFSVSAHAKDIWTTPDWEKQEKLAAAAWTVTCTAMNARHLRGLAPGADVELLYHGVDTARFAPRAEVPLQFPPPLGGAALLSISVARCVPKKGLGTLLEALALLPSDLVWQHVHIGGGPLAPELRGRAERLGIGAQIRWCGTISQLEVAALLAGADLFCLPSRIAADGDRDGLPNVLLEAMSMGLPVVATDVSAIPELVEHGRNGWLVPPDDPAALCSALERLIRDPELRARLGREGEATIRRRFSSETGLDRLAARFGLGPPLSRAA